jgi:gliding motility-associated-like protein
MSLLLKRVLFVGLLSWFNTAQAQIDTIFWFAAPEVSASVGDNPIYLRFMTYQNASDVSVTVPANGGFAQIDLTIPANSVDSINLTPFLSSIESPAADLASNNGIKITATENISAFYELKSPTNKEVFSLKGNKSIGQNFYTPFQKFWDNAVTAPVSFSSIDIVATEDGTTVLITPRTGVVGPHVQDVSFSVLLNEGQTYSARDIDVNGSTTLAGSIIAADKPIAVTVFTGALINGGCVSTMGDQITPVPYTGTKFVVNTGTSSNDRVYILATQNGTSVSVENSGSTSTLINWGETFEISVTDAINYISTSKPVYVWHTSGYGCELSGAQVPNLQCAGTYNTAFTRTTTDSLGLILYTRSGFEGQFALNGVPALIPALAFTDVPGTSGEYKSAIIYYNTTDVPLNSYNEVTNTGDIFGLGVVSGNGGSGSSYAYLSEFNSYPFIDAGLDDTICANTSISITGLIGGGDVTGVWSTSGFGGFSSTTDALINTYVPSPLDTLISPIQLILTTTGPCPVLKDTIFLDVDPSPIVSASADQSVCENNSVVLLAGSVNGGAATGYWASSGTGTFSPDSAALDANYLPSAADLSAGSVELVLISTNFGSCLAESDTMEILFTSAALVDAGIPDTIFVCENNTAVSLGGSVSGVTTTGKWLSSGTGVFSPDNLDLNANYQPSIADITAGEVWIFLESTSNGGCVPVQDSLLVSFTPAPVVNAGTNFIACSNDAAIVLSGTVGGGTSTGVWSGGNGIYALDSADLGAAYTPTAAEITGGTMFLTLTSTNNGGCLAVTGNVQINFVAPPFANFSFTEECLYNQSAFNDFSLPGYGNLDSWQWNFGDLGTSANQNEMHDYAIAGTYNVQLIVGSDAGCYDTLTQQVQAFEVPVSGFSFIADCPNNQIIVNFTDESTSVADAINFWHYDFGGQGTSAMEDPTQLFSSNGDYTILHIVGTANGCYDTTSQILSVPPFPVADFSYNSSNGLNVGAIFNFVNTSTDATSYFWNFGNTNTSTATNPSNTYFQNGIYTVTLFATSDLGCVDSTSQFISIETITTEISTIIPNAISPNGDFKNDVWKLEFIDILFPNAHVDIFNEWGQLLFESDGYDIPWDGKFNNEFVPDGTYYYIIDLRDSGDPEKDIFKGTLLVLKSKN